MSVRRMIKSLNALGVGELSLVLARLDETRRAVREREGLAEIAGLLDEAHGALSRGDLTTYRKRLARALADLGHAADD